jgi:hypothetical protein
MPRRAPFAVLLCLGALAILSPSATAITLTNHVALPHGITGKSDRHQVVVTTVAPPDSDDDGCPNDQDSYDGPGCNEPAPVAQPVSEPIAPTPAPTSTVAPSTAGGCPSYMAAEASSPTATNPTSGAYGCFQVLPSTSKALGCDLSTMAGQFACKDEICATSGNGAWSASGATPCG